MLRHSSQRSRGAISCRRNNH